MLRGVPGSSPITDPRLRPKRTRSKGPFLRQHYPASTVVWPSPTPVRPAACASWGAASPQSRRVSPDDPHHPSTVPCPVPRRIEAGACVDCFPAHTAFPVSQAGRHPHLHFRGLLRLYSRYGPLDCSTAQGGLCHEASTRSVTRPSRSSATKAIDNSPGEIFLYWWSAPSGRTEISRLGRGRGRRPAL